MLISADGILHFSVDGEEGRSQNYKHDLRDQLMTRSGVFLRALTLNLFNVILFKSNLI